MVAGDVVNMDLLKTLERIRRSFAAQWAHTMMLHRGGLYRTAALLNPLHVPGTVAYFKRVTCGMLWFEDAMADDSEDAEWANDEGLQAFRGLLVWQHSQLYREVMISGIRYSFVWEQWQVVVLPIVIRIHSGFETEKSIEDCFNAWRRVAKKTENGQVSCNTLYATLRKKSKLAYRNVAHQEEPTAAGGEWKQLTEADIVKRSAGTIAFAPVSNIQLASSTWHGDHGTDLKSPSSGHPTCGNFDYVGQVALEFAFSLMNCDIVDHELTVPTGNIDVLRYGWISSLVPGMHEQDGERPPQVLYEASTQFMWVVLCTLIGRALVMWPL